MGFGGITAAQGHGDSRKGVREAVDEIFPKGVLKMPRRVWAVQL